MRVRVASRMVDACRNAQVALTLAVYSTRLTFKSRVSKESRNGRCPGAPPLASSYITLPNVSRLRLMSRASACWSLDRAAFAPSDPARSTRVSQALVLLTQALLPLLPAAGQLPGWPVVLPRLLLVSLLAATPAE